jgi:hypothetical protein
MMDAWQQDLTTVANSMVDWFRLEHGIPVGVNVQLAPSIPGTKNEFVWMLEFIFPKDINISLNKVSWFQNYFLPNAFAGTKNLAWRVTYNA